MKEKFKEKFLMWLCDYSYRIIAYLLYSYFITIIVLNNFFNVRINKITSYLFWLLLGLYLGYTIALQVFKYLNKKSDKKKNLY